MTGPTVTSAPDVRGFDPWRRPGRLRIGWTSLASMAMHAGLVLLVMHVVVRTPRTPAPIRVSFIDPAPPPPAGNGAAASAPPAAAPPVIAPPAQPEHPAGAAPVQPKPAPRIHRAAKPVPAKQPPAAAAEASAPAAEAAAIPGEPQGVPGGVAGGRAGGILGGTGHTLISAEEAARQPILTKKVVPEYPPMARMRGIEGQVVLQAILSRDGAVEPDIQVLQSVPLLDAAAIAAVRQWRFRPARDQDGEPLRVTLRVPVRFVLR
jgi:protein TonB